MQRKYQVLTSSQIAERKIKWTIYICLHCIRWFSSWAMLFSLNKVFLFFFFLIIYCLKVCVCCHYPHLSDNNCRFLLRTVLLPGSYFSKLVFSSYCKNKIIRILKGILREKIALLTLPSKTIFICLGCFSLPFFFFQTICTYLLQLQ